MNIDPEHPMVAKPQFDERQLIEDQRNELRVTELLNFFITHAVTSMDALFLSLTEGRKEDALMHIDSISKSAQDIHGETLVVILERLRLAIAGNEASESIQCLLAQCQTAFQGTLDLVKQSMISRV